MTTLDLVLVMFVVVLAVWGFRQGALIGISSLVGFLGGTLIGTRIAAAVLAEGSQSPYAPLFGLAGGLAFGAFVAEVTMTLGYRFRSRFTSSSARRVDGSLGAVLFGTFALAIVWIGAAAVSQSRVSPDFASAVRQSKVVQQLNGALPPSGPVLGALARIDPFPSINGPAAGVDAPNAQTVSDPEIQAAGQSVVRVVGTACGYGVTGSGWVAGNDVIATNAHVVAGMSDVAIEVGGEGAPIAAGVIWFDPVNDLALLAVPGLGLPVLPLDAGDAEGTAGAVLGYPESGPYDVQPARVGQSATVFSRDIYEGGPIQRRMVAFRALVRHGNSGGPLVDENGIVRAVVFAKALDREGEGFGVPVSIVSDALSRAVVSQPVGTGPCA